MRNIALFVILICALSPVLLLGQSKPPRITKAKANVLVPRLYKINRIDSMQTVYLVYATRNDSIFKIVSGKSHAKSSKSCMPIRVGKLYSLRLDKGINMITDNIGTWNGIPLDDESRRNLYEAYNLKGLCVK